MAAHHTRSLSGPELPQNIFPAGLDNASGAVVFSPRPRAATIVNKRAVSRRRTVHEVAGKIACCAGDARQLALLGQALGVLFDAASLH